MSADRPGPVSRTETSTALALTSLLIATMTPGRGRLGDRVHGQFKIVDHPRQSSLGCPKKPLERGRHCQGRRCRHRLRRRRSMIQSGPLDPALGRARAPHSVIHDKNAVKGRLGISEGIRSDRPKLFVSRSERRPSKCMVQSEDAVKGGRRSFGVPVRGSLCSARQNHASPE